MIPMTILSSVDLPLPFGPVTATKRSSIVRLISFRISLSSFSHSFKQISEIFHPKSSRIEKPYAP